MMCCVCLCYSLVSWFAVYLCKHLRWLSQEYSCSALRDAHLEQNRCFALEQSLSCEAQLDASWLLAGQMYSQGGRCSTETHRHLWMSSTQLQHGSSWSSVLALVDLPKSVQQRQLWSSKRNENKVVVLYPWKERRWLFFVYFAFELRQWCVNAQNRLEVALWPQSVCWELQSSDAHVTAALALYITRAHLSYLLNSWSYPGNFLCRSEAKDN